MTHKPLRLGRFWLAALCLAGFAGTIDLGAWLWATNRLLTGFEDWRTDQAASGLDVRTGTPARAGWPFAAEIVVPDVTLAAGTTAAWHAGAVQLRITPLHPTTLAILPMGHQTLHLAGLPLIGLDARALAASVPLDAPEITAAGQGIALAADAGTASIDTLAVEAKGMAAAIALTRVAFQGLPFDEPIASASAQLHLTALPQGQGSPAQRATTWTQAGGQIVADAISLHWGTLDAAGHFTAGLDAARQVTAQGSVRLTGFDPALDTLVRAGTIGRNAATVAKTVLGLMAAGAPASADGAVDVPFTLRAGTLAMGGIPLARIPLLMWP